MECFCSISMGYDGGPLCSHEGIRKAIKIHKCCECYKTISPGEQYEYISGIWDDGPETYKTCLDCKSLRNVFFEDWTFTTMWDDFFDNFYTDDIPEKCLSALTTKARERVCKWIENSWDEF